MDWLQSMYGKKMFSFCSSERKILSREQPEITIFPAELGSFQKPCYTFHGALQTDLCIHWGFLVCHSVQQIYTSLTKRFELNMNFGGEDWEKNLCHPKNTKSIFSHVFSPFLGASLRSNSAENYLKDCVGIPIDYLNRWCKSHWSWCCDLTGAKLLLMLWEYLKNSWLHVELGDRFVFAQPQHCHCSTTMHPVK